MGLAFPNAPSIGQIVSGYTWDGEKWTLAVPHSLAGTLNPLVNGIAAPGVSGYYSREDHVHPQDLAYQAADAAALIAANAAYQAKDAQLFAGIPIVDNALKTGAYSCVLGDAQKAVAGYGAWTINSLLAWPLGTVISFAAYGGTPTVALTGGPNLYWWNGSAIVSGTRTMGNGSIATAWKATVTDWLITGNGLT